MLSGLSTAGAILLTAAEGPPGTANGSERLRAIRESMESSPGQGWLIAAVVLLLLLLLLVLCRAIVVAVRRRRRLVADWQEFARSLNDLELAPAHRKLLSQLVTRQCPDRPLDVMREIAVFERAAHAYLGPLCKGGPGEGARRAATAIHVLRSRMNFERPSGVTYYSTRELQAGQHVQITFGERPEPPACWAVVGEQREDFLPLRDIRPLPDEAGSRTVQVVFFNKGRAYGFDTRVVDRSREDSSFLLAHTLDVRTAGAREHHRVRVDGPVVFRAEWEAPEAWHKGTLRDLSLGGLALVCPCYYQAGEELVLDLRTSAYLPDEPPGGELEEERRLEGTIVSMERIEGGRGLYRIQFRDMDAAEGRYLFRLVQKLELSTQE